MMSNFSLFSTCKTNNLGNNKKKIFTEGVFPRVVASNYVIEAKSLFIVLGQRMANIFCKGPLVNI